MLKIAGRTVAGLYLAYLALATLVILPAVNFLAPWYIDREYGRELRTDIILFNPFTLAAEVRGAQLLESDGSPFLALDQAKVDLSLQTLWRKGLVLDLLSVTGLQARIRHLGEQQFNFSDLLGPETPETPTTEDSADIPALTVHRLEFDADIIELIDEARETPFRTHYDGIDIVVTDLSTIQEDGKPYRIEAVAESGGELSWEGDVSIPAANSEGKISLSNVSLRTFWRFAEPWLNFELHEGRASLSGNYRISWENDFSYQVNSASLQIADIDLKPKRPGKLGETAAGLSGFTVNGIELDSERQHLEVASVQIEGLGVSGWMEGERMSLLEMLSTEFPAEDSSSEPVDDSDAGWTAHVADVQLQAGQLHWRSEFTDPPRISISPIEARIQSVRWPLADVSPLELQFTLNQTTQFQLNGELALDKGIGALDYSLAQLAVPLFNPNLPSALKATIQSGKVDVSGSLTLDEFLPVEIAMDGEFSDFSGVLYGSEEALTRWDSLRWQKLQVNLEQRTAYLEKLLIHDYQGRIHIAADGSVNASKVWQEEVGERAEEIVEDLELDQPWQLEIPEIFISDSAIDFKDESLPIQFRTVIGDVNGQILNLGTAADAVTEVDVKGTVDGYAPVVLNGTAEPFREPPALDLGLSFTGVDLVLLTPYSGTYAGYAIEQGLLTLDLKYSLEDNQLKGNNDVVVEQLKLGEKIDSDKALDLPLELALALLTDLNGVISLDVPVQGDIDDPEFALGGVIAGAFVNLITKAVTAPFNLLASLVGSEDDLQRIAFPAGSSELNPPALNKLEQLTQALLQRPKLTLVVTGRLNLDSDRERLQRQLLEAQLLAEGVPQDDISRRGDAYVKAVEKRYRDLTGDSSDENSFSQQLAAVRGSITVEPAALLQLAQDRAVAVKDHLVNNLGLPADRAVINQGSQLDVEEHTYSGVELELGG